MILYRARISMGKRASQLSSLHSMQYHDSSLPVMTPAS
jgi:hypothetical protein